MADENQAPSHIGDKESTPQAAAGVTPAAEAQLAPMPPHASRTQLENSDKPSGRWSFGRSAVEALRDVAREAMQQAPPLLRLTVLLFVAFGLIALVIVVFPPYSITKSYFCLTSSAIFFFPAVL